MSDNLPPQGHATTPNAVHDKLNTEESAGAKDGVSAMAMAGSTPGRSWATGDQWIFLETNCTAYWEAKARSTLPAFYEKIVTTWVEKGFGSLADIGCTKLPSKDLAKDVYDIQIKKRAKTVSILTILYPPSLTPI